MKYSFILFLIAAVAVASCSGKLKRADTKLKPIETPFDKKKYFSDKKFYRAMGEGRAKDLTVAKRIAETNARQAIASQIDVQVRSVAEQFLQNRNVSNKLETTSKYEDLTRTVIDQTLNQVKIVDQESFQDKKKGDFVHYVAMEMSTTAIQSKMEDGISADDALKQDFELERFRKIYQEELDKFKDGR
ncbi:MAG: LPP20 family lipoprotein [Bacteroidota bacterium]